VADLDYERKLVGYVGDFIQVADRGEERRRRFDRLGAQLIYSQHWDPQIIMPESRSAGTFNVAKAILLQKIAVMTKQRPIPVVNPKDAGDKEAAKILRKLLIDYFCDSEVDFQEKLRLVMLLCHCTRTAALKAWWDPTLHGGAGNIACGPIPPWRLILDDRCTNINRMRFAGDRAPMPRSLAMRYYPKAAKKIARATTAQVDQEEMGAGGYSPISDPYRDSPTQPQSTVINGKPLITAFAGQAPSSSDTTDWVEPAEIYWKDDTMHLEIVTVRDVDGNPVHDYIYDDDGFPVIEQGDEEDITDENGSFSMPTFAFKTEIRTETKPLPNYGYLRRTTILYPDRTLLDDCPWDGPFPYALFQADLPLDGIWSKGPLLDCEDATNMLNVAVSIVNDNMRIKSWQAFIASRSANLERNSFVIEPGGVIMVSGAVNEAIKPLDVAGMDQGYFTFINLLVGFMERMLGAEGVMQGQSEGRADSAQAYDQLAEIGGSRIVECTQRMEQSIADFARIIIWFAQHKYTEKHAIAVEDKQGGLTYERVSGARLAGSLDAQIEVGSTMAWSESAREARILNRLQQGLYDKVEAAKLLGISNWQEIFQRMVSEPPALAGPGLAPPKRTRTSPPKMQGNGRANRTGSLPRA
jgi:hypothetical protein